MVEIVAELSEDSGAGAAIAAPSHDRGVKGTEGMTTPHEFTPRKPLSVRTRFEVFKRDDFMCRYCGRKSPEVILEVDHVVPVCDGGDNDPMNLVTACWACNSGKSGVPLDRVISGDDPYEKAIEALERERQLREYNAVMTQIRERREAEFCDLRDWWCEEVGKERIGYQDVTWLKGALLFTAAEDIRYAMAVAIGRGHTRDFRYVGGVIRSQREARMQRSGDAG